MPLPLKNPRRHNVSAQKRPKHLLLNFHDTPGASGKAGADSINSPMRTIPIKLLSTSNLMPNLGHRLTKASEESAQATRRIAAAEGKIARTLIDMVRDDEAHPSRPMKNATPPKHQPPRR